MNRKILLTLILLLSGLSGISYEILYGRILGGILGDQFAVSSAVLITFLLGIGLGARHAHRLWRWLWAVEALIGCYGIGFALSRNAIEHLLYDGMSFLPSLVGPILLGTTLLLFPALLLGCSVPLFAGYLGRMNDTPVFARVYSIYNFGAAATALLIEFLLIRQFGITGTVVVFGLVNLLAASLLFFAGKPIAVQPPAVAAATKLPRHHFISLVLISIASALFQLFMVKIAEMMFGPFRESFALVLAIILFGISLGAYLVRRLNIRYTALLLTNVLGLVLILVMYRDLLYVYADLYEKAVEHGRTILWLKGAILVALMGLPALTFGATIPALLNSSNEVAKESGALLYISSLANVAGFLLMALVLHQFLDYGVQLLVIAALSVLALLVYQWQTLREWRKSGMSVAAALLLSGGMAYHHASWDEDLLYLSYTSFHSAKDMTEDRKAFNFPEKFKGYQDVFSINWSGGNPYFFINGYISIPMNNPSEKVVGAVGSMYSPSNKEALVLGLGSGGTASVVGLLFDHTDVVEINPVVRENQFRMKRWNFDIEHNPRVNIVVDDAIHYIQSETKTYDMILNTVTSPLYFSSSKLYTIDFFEKIKKRLNPDGVYLTWMDSRIGSQGARIVLNTVRQRFRHCAIVFIKSGYYLLIASDDPVRLQHPDLVDKAPELKKNLMQNKIIPRQLAYNLLTPEVFTDEMKFDVPINTINQPVLEFEMASLKKKEFTDFQKQLYASMSLDAVAEAVAPAMKYDPVEHIAHVKMALKNSGISARLEQLGRIYVSELDNRVDEAMLGAYRSIAHGVDDAETRHQMGDQLRMRHRYAEALAEYQAALTRDPRHKDTRFNLAACLEYLGEREAALEQFRQASQQFPDDMDALYRMARLQLKLGQLPSALADIERVLTRQVNEEHYALKADILQALGQHEAAQAVYRQMLQLNPDNPDAQYELNQVMAKW